MSLQIVCCADKPPQPEYYTWREFNDSLARHGFEPVVLGWGERWRGLGSKPKLLKSAIDTGRITASTIMFVDAFDVIFARSPHEVAEAVCGTWPNLILWNGERNCFPDATLADKHPKTEHPYCYLNSGVSIGPTDLYRDALNEMEAEAIPEDYQKPDGQWHHENDQDNWMRQFLFGEVPMALDTNADLFQTLHGAPVTELEIDGPRIRNTITNTYPAVFHFNGGGKTGGLREPIIQALKL